MKRGEVWLVDFGLPLGPEQAGQRPAIVLQDDVFTPILTTVVVLPLTTNLERLSFPTTILIPAGEGGLLRDSACLCHQVQVRGKVRLLNRLGELSADRLAEVQDCLLTTLGM
jgi:mRNA interferase MazF